MDIGKVAASTQGKLEPPGRQLSTTSNMSITSIPCYSKYGSQTGTISINQKRFKNARSWATF